MAARRSAPAAGVVAAVVAALAANLAGMAAAFTATDADGQTENDEAAQDLELLRSLGRDALALADADEVVYTAVLRATDEDQRREALHRATDVPFRLVEVACEVATVAGRLATTARPALRGDAEVAAIIAAAAARGAAHLVRCNVDAGGLDPALVARADELVAEAAASATSST